MKLLEWNKKQYFVEGKRIWIGDSAFDSKGAVLKNLGPSPLELSSDTFQLKIRKEHDGT
jgi:hypothetical protein